MAPLRASASASLVGDGGRASERSNRSLRRSETAPTLPPPNPVADALCTTFPRLKRTGALDSTPPATPRAVRSARNRRKFRPTATAAAALEGPTGEEVVQFFATHGSDSTIKFVPLVGEGGLREEKRRRDALNESLHRQTALPSRGSSTRMPPPGSPLNRSRPPSSGGLIPPLKPLDGATPLPAPPTPTHAVRDRVVHDFQPRVGPRPRRLLSGGLFFFLANPHIGTRCAR